MIVCHCAGVTDATIARVIEQGASSVADVARLTGAGRRCSPCREEISNLLALELSPAPAFPTTHQSETPQTQNASL